MMKHLVLFFNSYFSTTFVEDSKKQIALTEVKRITARYFPFRKASGMFFFGINCTTADQSWETSFPKNGRMNQDEENVKL